MSMIQSFGVTTLLIGCVSYLLFGTYITILSMAIYSSHRYKGPKSAAQKRIRWIIWATGLLLICRQITTTMLTRYYFCIAVGAPEENQYASICPDVAGSDDPNTVWEDAFFVLGMTIPSIVNMYVPPLVALLSDGILAWRVFVVWNRPLWLQVLLALGVITNCGVGLALAIIMSIPNYGGENVAFIAQAWAWMAFGLNSVMSASILIRISAFEYIRRRGLQVNNRYGTVIMALVESAVLSWIATLGCAIAWSVRSACGLPFQNGCFWASIGLYTDTVGERYAASIFVALPTLLGISQVLMITRINAFKLGSPHEVAQTISLITDDYRVPENGIPLQVIATLD